MMNKMTRNMKIEMLIVIISNTNIIIVTLIAIIIIVIIIMRSSNSRCSHIHFEGIGCVWPVPLPPWSSWYKVGGATEENIHNGESCLTTGESAACGNFILNRKPESYRAERKLAWVSSLCCTLKGQHESRCCCYSRFYVIRFWRRHRHFRNRVGQ